MITSIQTPNRRTQEHLRFLDGLRGVAALTVFFGHALSFSQDGGIFAGHLWCIGLTGYAVPLFIMLSGFCLMLPVIRNNGELPGGAGRFFKRRAHRILPPYYLAMGLSLLIIKFLVPIKLGTVFDYALPIKLAGIVSHLLLLHDLVYPLMINGVFWSIAVECQIYLLFPLLVRLWRTSPVRITILLVAVTTVAAYAVRHQPRLNGMHLEYIGLFALGALAATLTSADVEQNRRIIRRVPWPIVSVVAGLLWGGATVAIIVRGYEQTLLCEPLLALCLFAALVALAQANSSPVKRLMENRTLVHVGAISYSLYLIHLPLQQVIWKWALLPIPLTNPVRCLLMATAGNAIILGVVTLFYRFCERPFLNAKRSVPA